ncbi:MAG: hypothetical protein ACOX8W_06085 [bacterium]
MRVQTAGANRRLLRIKQQTNTAVIFGTDGRFFLLRRRNQRETAGRKSPVYARTAKMAPRGGIKGNEPGRHYQRSKDAGPGREREGCHARLRTPEPKAN